MTIELPLIEMPRRRGLFRADLVDRNGRPVARAWVPSGARVVTVLGRVFLHYERRVWREVSTVDAVGLVWVDA